jgi:Tfp pilus assembly protein PilO
MRSLQSQITWCARGQWALGGLIVVVVLAFYALGFRPLSHRLSNLRWQITQRQRDVLAGRNETKVLPDIAGEVKRLQGRLERSNKSIPPQQELSQFIKDITQLSQQANLKKFSYKPGVATRGEQVCELPIPLVFEGDFLNVYAFLRNVEEMPRMTRVRGMQIKAKDRDKGEVVQVQLSMNIYFAAEQ